nr:unnamed protein product [Digitaria exilis]
MKIEEAVEERVYRTGYSREQQPAAAVELPGNGRALVGWKEGDYGIELGGGGVPVGDIDEPPPHPSLLLLHHSSATGTGRGRPRPWPPRPPQPASWGQTITTAARSSPSSAAARAVAAPHVCRKCHKEFATGVALGGHMRVHYTGKPIVPKRRKTNNKQRALALLPLVEHHGGIAAPSSSPGISLALSINTAEDAPSPSPAGADGSRVVRLFGIDISAQQVQESSSEQQCSGTTADVSAQE